MIGNQWAETGAGKRQHDIDVAEERRVLAEAAAKEKADEDREKVRPSRGFFLTCLPHTTSAQNALHFILGGGYTTVETAAAPSEGVVVVVVVIVEKKCARDGVGSSRQDEWSIGRGRFSRKERRTEITYLCRCPHLLLYY